MNTKIVLTSLLAFVVGGAAAWMVRTPPDTGGGLPSARNAKGLAGCSGGDGKAGVESAAVMAWRALGEDKMRGMAVHLGQAELIPRATARDMPRLLELAGKDEAAREMLLRRWAELDPAGAADWLAPAMKEENLRRSDVAILYSAWAKKDPAAAMAKLKSLVPLGPVSFWTGSILKRLLDEDMAAGVKFGALSAPAISLSQVHYNGGSGAWVEKDPVKAAALLSALPQSQFRDDSLDDAIRALAKKDLNAAIALQKKFPELKGEWVTENVRGDFYTDWARKDPAAMTEFMNGEASTRDRPVMKAALPKAMADKDPQAALAWSAENLSGRNRSEVVEGILTKLTRDHPDAALAYLDSLSAGTALDSALDTFSKALPGGDPQALLEKAESLPEGAARSSLMAKAYGKMYEKDPETMLKNLASQPASSLPEGLWNQLGASTGSMSDGLKRLDALPPEAAREFLSGLFRSKIDYDGFNQFTAAMSSLSAPDQRAAAMEAGLRQLFYAEPAQVTNWAKSLPAGERALVADQMEKTLYNLTENQKRELIAPLRSQSTP